MRHVIIKYEVDNFLPRNWYEIVYMQYSVSVFPAYAGMNLLINPLLHLFIGIPRIRRDEPHWLPSQYVESKYSPHTRG